LVDRVGKLLEARKFLAKVAEGLQI
jgi:hypothetical protein